MSTGGPGAWPPAVREWVSKCLKAMNSTNREAAQAELKTVIADAYAKNTLWTTDWSTKQLESLKQPSGLKRKIETPPAEATNKKSKLVVPTSVPPSYNSNGLDRLQERAKRFQREHEIERQKKLGHTKNEQYSLHVNSSNGQASSSGPSYSVRRKFLASGPASQSGPEPAYDGNVVDWDKFTIVGTSEELFKPYLRLTSAPDPSKIRPIRVLEKTLKELSKRWRTQPDYLWTCDQFKSLRQDLTVQRIKNEFTASVYEIHARMALESADLVEYNQCQAVLRDLYALGIKGSSAEFLAYRILYLCHTRDRSELNRFIATLTAEQKNQVFIKQALDIQRALATNNYHKFFKLFQAAHNMGGYILDHLVDRVRISALVIMTKAYQQVKLSQIASELQFDPPEAAVQFLEANDAAFFVSKPGSTTSSSSVKPGSSTTNGASNTPHLSSRVSSLSINDEGPLEGKILDCKLAHPPLVDCLATKHARVGIKGSI
ncbi:hypothetical protein DL93DRAFT_2230490 [Clavulina sp. PMI_390]|nr:hypothetical protein DL93DRAFT_2230490 [Clavulina sp. PMI_390]